MESNRNGKSVILFVCDEKAQRLIRTLHQGTFLAQPKKDDIETYLDGTHLGAEPAFSWEPPTQKEIFMVYPG